MSEKPPIVLTIAGFDPSSGAGVTADIKTIAAHGCYGVACITAMTVQSTAGVKRVEAVDPARRPLGRKGRPAQYRARSHPQVLFRRRPPGCCWDQTDD